MMDKMDMYQEKRIIQVEEAVKTLNREMGELLGEVRGLKYMLGVGFGATVLVQLVNLFRGG